jgi:hypothetical protein
MRKLLLAQQAAPQEDEPKTKTRFGRTACVAARSGAAEVTWSAGEKRQANEHSRRLRRDYFAIGPSRTGMFGEANHLFDVCRTFHRKKRGRLGEPPEAPAMGLSVAQPNLSVANFSVVCVNHCSPALQTDDSVAKRS